MNMRKDLDSRKKEILDWISEDITKAEISRRLQCKPETFNSWLKRNDIVYTGHPNQKGVYKGNNKKSVTEYLKNKNIKSHILRVKLIEDGIKEHKCEGCGLTAWKGKPIPLELHHKDGNHNNNELNNLELLCPNCHAFTDNYRGKGKKRE